MTQIAIILDDNICIEYAKEQRVYDMVMLAERKCRKEKPDQIKDSLSIVKEVGGEYFCFSYFFRHPVASENGWSLMITSSPQIVDSWQNGFNGLSTIELKTIVVDMGRRN